MSEPVGYIVKKMPDFYFMPVFLVDTIFSAWTSWNDSWRCPKWASEHVLEVIRLRECVPGETPLCWVIVGYNGTFDEETAESAELNGKKVIPCVELK